MNRKEIRQMARFYIQELTERPEGMIRDEYASETDLNNLINAAQDSVETDLIALIPEWFRSSFLISTVIAKADYHVETDLSITDFLRMEEIFHNESGKSPTPLPFVRPTQLSEHGITAAQTGEPKVWMWEKKLTIGLRPIPTAADADKYKAYYFIKVPKLNQDTDHDPATGKYAIPFHPEETHELIAVDAAMRCLIASQNDVRNADILYQKMLRNVAEKLFSIEPVFSRRGGMSVSKLIG